LLELPAGALRCASRETGLLYYGWTGEGAGGACEAKNLRGEGNLRVTQLSVDLASARDIAIRANGPELAAIDGDQIRRFRPLICKPTEIGSVSAPGANCVAFDKKDGLFLAAGDMEGRVRIWSAEDTGNPLIIKPSKKAIVSLCFDADGQRLFIMDAAGVLSWFGSLELKREMVACTKIRPEKVPSRNLTQFGLPDQFEYYTVACGDKLAVGGSGDLIWIVDPKDWFALPIETPMRRFVRRLEWRHNQRLCVVGDSGVAFADVGPCWRNPARQPFCGPLVYQTPPGWRTLAAVETGIGSETRLRVLAAPLPVTHLNFLRELEERCKTVVARAEQTAAAALPIGKPRQARK